MRKPLARALGKCQDAPCQTLIPMDKVKTLPAIAVFMGKTDGADEDIVFLAKI